MSAAVHDGSVRRAIDPGQGAGHRTVETVFVSHARTTRFNMTHIPNELADLFPDDADLIHRLKGENAHFAKLADQHHEITRVIHRIETDIEPTSDAHAEDLKKQRLALQDEIAGMLSGNR
jgi:uncharacterized protein YdcH (DUF465 family)